MKKLSNKKLIVTFMLLLITLAGASAVSVFKQKDGSQAVIYVGGVEQTRVDLRGFEGLIELPGNVLLVDVAGISMHSATCPDQLCVRQGRAEIGRPVVCLPNRVVVEIVASGGEIDAISGR